MNGFAFLVGPVFNLRLGKWSKTMLKTEASEKGIVSFITFRTEKSTTIQSCGSEITSDLFLIFGSIPSGVKRFLTCTETLSDYS